MIIDLFLTVVNTYLEFSLTKSKPHISQTSMANLQGSSSSPQLQTVRGSPSSSSVTKSPSQFSAASLLAASSSPSPGTRKRLHPDYLKLDDAAPPNKKLNTPTVSLFTPFCMCGCKLPTNYHKRPYRSLGFRIV